MKVSKLNITNKKLDEVYHKCPFCSSTLNSFEVCKCEKSVELAEKMYNKVKDIPITQLTLDNFNK